MPYFMTGALTPQITATANRLKSAQNRDEDEIGLGVALVTEVNSKMLRKKMLGRTDTAKGRC